MFEKEQYCAKSGSITAFRTLYLNRILTVQKRSGLFRCLAYLT